MLSMHALYTQLLFMIIYYTYYDSILNYDGDELEDNKNAHELHLNT